VQTSLSDNPIRCDLARDARGALDEDLYCLTCGYNLRGLVGDPIRCPECGAANDLGTALIPAARIREALERMETAPTGCVAAAVIAATVVASRLLTAAPAFAVSCGLLYLCGCGWWLGYAKMKAGYADQPGWRRVLLDFHLTTLLFLSGIPATMIAYWICAKPVNQFPDGLAVTTFLLSIPLAWLGLHRYRHTRERIAAMQRDRAVQLARDTLRKSLQTPRRFRNS
jgi:hypothetical protein